MQETKSNYRPSQRTLSIRSNPGGFSFCSSTAKGDVYRELKLASNFDFPERFEDFVQTRGWAEKENLHVTVIEFSDRFMLLPLEITEEEQIQFFFNFQFQQEKDRQLFTTPLSDGKQMICWDIPNNRNQCFEQLFPKLTVLSSAYLLANWTTRQATLSSKAILVAHIYGKSMHIFAAENQTLLFANTFPINSHEELPYYLLRCMEQLSLSPIYTHCVFCTESVPEQEVTEIFQPYIKHIKMAAFTHQTDEPLQFTENNK